MQRSLSATCPCRNLCHFLSYHIDVERGSPLSFPRPTYRCTIWNVVVQLCSRNNQILGFFGFFTYKIKLIHRHLTVTYSTSYPKTKLMLVGVLQHPCADKQDIGGCSACLLLQTSTRLFCLVLLKLCKSAKDCMENAEEVRNAPLFEASVYIWRHKACYRSAI